MLCKVCNLLPVAHSGRCGKCQYQARKEYKKQWNLKNKEKIREDSKAIKKRCTQKLKQEVIDKYGGKCTCCGENTLVFLTIDHIKNDGAEDRSAGLKGDRMYRYLRHVDLDFAKYQVLCWNCNWAKRMGCCPHKKEKNVT